MDITPAGGVFQKTTVSSYAETPEPSAYFGPQPADGYGGTSVGESDGSFLKLNSTVFPGEAPVASRGKGFALPWSPEKMLFMVPSVCGPVKASMVYVTDSLPLDIIYTNDIHGAMLPMKTKEGIMEGGVSYLAGKIEELRYEAGGNSLVLDGGDWGQGTMESNLSKGAVMTEVMNAINYDAMEIGNHEFDWGPLNLQKIIQAARVPLLGANIAHTDGTTLDGVKPYLLKEVNGIKVGIIGLINEDAAQGVDPANVKGITFLKTKETAERCIQDLKREGAQFIVALTHNGDACDEELAAHVKGLDLIVGGHSHTTISEPRVVGSTIIVQAGTQGRQVGHMKLSLVDEMELEMDIGVTTLYGMNKADNYPAAQGRGTDMLTTLSAALNDAEAPYQLDAMQLMPAPRTSRAMRIVDYRNAMVPIRPGEGCSADEKVESILRQALEHVKEKADQVLSTLAFDMPHDRLKVEESTLGNFLTDAIRHETGADMAFQTSSGIRDSLNRGPLKYGDLYRVFPFDNVTATVELTGDQVKTILEHSATQVKDYMQVSGLTLEIDRGKPAGERVSNVKVNGELLEPGKKYRVAVNDLLMKGGFGYSEFARGENIQYGKLQRECLMDYMAAHKEVSALPAMGRLNFKR